MKKDDNTVKNIGIPIKNPPKTTCNDPNCPFHGSVKIRGRIHEGVVKSSKAQNTVTVEWNYVIYLTKYERYEKHKTLVVAHNPPCMNVVEGDKVVLGECRRLSKTKSFVIIDKL
ncbi:MAG: 30S ribosomal protein S17 [DPANN group archaeon]|nr:30S ribosomal protein S17 [DPANN group archaeon]